MEIAVNGINERVCDMQDTLNDKLTELYGRPQPEKEEVVIDCPNDGSKTSSIYNKLTILSSRLSELHQAIDFI